MDIVISNIGQLVTPIERAFDTAASSYSIDITNDTQLYIRNGQIARELPSRTSGNVQTIDADGGVVMPGLIDPFWIMPCLPTWIDQLPESKSQSSNLLSWSVRLFQQAMRSGVTTIEVKCPHDSEFEGLAALGHLSQHHQPRVIGALLASLPESNEDRDRRVSALIGEVIPEIRHRRLATFCDIGWGKHVGFVTEARAVLRAAIGAGLRPKLHIQAAPLMRDVAQLALSLEVTAVGCASHFSIDLVRDLANGHVLPVYLPAIQRDQVDWRIDVRTLLDQGVPVAIGSGNGLTESPLRSMWSVLASAIDRMKLTLPEAIVASTLNNARALELSHETGSLENGKRADLIVLDLDDYREIEMTPGTPPVSWVMINGEIAH